MGFNKFSFSIVLRTVLVMLSVMLLVIVLNTPGYHAVSVLMIIIIMLQLINLIRFVAKTNTELVRFFDAARYADYAQNFELKKSGSGFDELGVVFNDILQNLQLARTTQQAELKHMKALIEHLPVPVMSIHYDDKVTLWNNSARRLFSIHAITHVIDLAKFGHEFPDKLKSIGAGERQLIDLEIDGMAHRLSVSATQIVANQKTETILSLQDIQNELDVAQLQAWQDLVSVLTHEIMNSITPVASLANTAVDLVNDLKEKTYLAAEVLEDLDDVAGAVQTVARRSDSLVNFVSSYRRITRLPEPDKQKVMMSALFKNVQSVACITWAEKKIVLTTQITPVNLTVDLDIGMIEQILINLLLNAEQALTNIKDAHVSMYAYINQRGRVVLEITDNGTGVPEAIKQHIFVPFYTTKKEGSGVGLALARQVMVAHGGHIALDEKRKGGAKFSLTF